jgi:ArsR family transcriptional regulator, arsenate/arsenite/antimonite-responsive transcriptional repressor
MSTLTAGREIAADCCAPLMGEGLSPEEAGATASLFKALSDPTRVRIVNLLAGSPEPVCLCDINSGFELSQPTLSHHLKKLVAAGLLTREQRGTWAFYSINEEALRRLSDVVGQREIAS